jgi:hypothetical protein
VILSCADVLIRGLRSGIEATSKVIMPALFVILLILVVRSLTLPGAMAGVDWYILKFSPADINAKVVVAALGQAIFSLSLGGTFMVVYGSYLNAQDRLASNGRLQSATRRPDCWRAGDYSSSDGARWSRRKDQDCSFPRCPTSLPRFPSAGCSDSCSLQAFSVRRTSRTWRPSRYSWRASRTTRT